ncbi:unnamed protein product [Anisakis simplex]|uniref:Transcription factor n=1 Tax=Anisakis simplex TaxID=6269 RepID=A0A0M3JPB1_ANISI|nr:unnamed protein product [Anisakis simplex]
MRLSTLPSKITDSLINSASSPALLNGSNQSSFSASLESLQSDLLARFGLNGSDLLQSSPLLQGATGVLGNHSMNATQSSTLRHQASGNNLFGQSLPTSTHNSDTTKSVRFVFLVQLLFSRL